MAIGGCGGAPDGKAFFGGFERAVEIGRTGVRQARERLFCCRIDHVLAGAAVAVEPLAVDIKFEIGVHGILFASSDASSTMCDGALANELAGFSVAFIPPVRRHVGAPNKSPGLGPGRECM